MEVLHIYMTQAQQKKMASGKTIQLTANQLSSTNGEPVEIHMLKKHATAVRRAIRNGKGYRFTADKIEGGSFKNFAKSFSKGAKRVGRALDKFGRSKTGREFRNAFKPLGRALLKKGREMAHEKLNEALQEAQEAGYDIAPYAGTLHDAIEAKNVKDLKRRTQDLLESGVDDLNNRIENTTLDDLRGMKGNGLKGSQAMKDRMAKVRACRKVSGGNIKSTFKKIGRVMKSVGKNALKGLATAGLATAGNTLAGPLGGVVLASTASPSINKRIDGLGIKNHTLGNYINPDIGAGSGTLLKRVSIPKMKIRGGSFQPYQMAGSFMPN